MGRLAEVEDLRKIADELRDLDCAIHACRVDNVADALEVALAPPAPPADRAPVDSLMPAAAAGFERLAMAVEALVSACALHKKGFFLSYANSDPASMLLHCASELNEINEATTQDHAEQELGDVLAILVHVALVRGLDLGRACQRWIEKIPADFPSVRGLQDARGRPVGPSLPEVPRES